MSGDWQETTCKAGGGTLEAGLAAGAAPAFSFPRPHRHALPFLPPGIPGQMSQTARLLRRVEVFALSKFLNSR